MKAKPATRPPEPSGVSGIPRRLWRARSAIWTMAVRDLDYMKDFRRQALVILALVMVIGYFLAFTVFSGTWGAPSPLFDRWEPGRVSNIFYMITTVSVLMTAVAFGMAFTIQRMNGTMKNYFNHPVGVVEVVAAKLMHVFILGMTLVPTLVAPIIPFVQAGLLPPGAGVALALTAVLALLATYVSLIFGVALPFCVQERISRFRPELVAAASIALFLVLTRNFISKIGTFIVQARADAAGTPVTQADLDAVEGTSRWLSAFSPFEAALNLGQAAFSNPAFLWGLIVVVPIVGSVFFIGLARAAKVYPEAM